MSTQALSLNTSIDFTAHSSPVEESHSPSEVKPSQTGGLKTSESISDKGYRVYTVCVKNPAIAVYHRIQSFAISALNFIIETERTVWRVLSETLSSLSNGSGGVIISTASYIGQILLQRSIIRMVEQVVFFTFRAVFQR